MSGEEETDSEEDDEMDWMILDFFLRINALRFVEGHLVI
jgi:hypothetical protein